MKEKGIIISILVLTVSRALSTLLHQDLRMFFYVWDELLLILICVALSTRIFMNDRNFSRMRLTYTIISLFIIFFLAIEVAEQTPVLSKILNVTVTIVGENALEGAFRAGEYRAQGFFDTSLTFAEYLLYVAVIFVLFISKTSKRNKSVYVTIGIIFLASTVFTGARFPIVVIGLILVSYAFFNVIRLVSVGSQKVLILSLFVIVMSSVVAFSSILVDIEFYVDSFAFLIGDDISSRASVISRANQWIAIPAEVSSNQFLGILGEGYRSDLIERIDVKLDSYFFRLLIEGGWLAMSAFLLIFLKSVISCAAFSKNRNIIINDLAVKDVAFFLSVLFSIFFITKLFLSMNFNNYLLFVFLGLLFSLHARKEPNAHPPHP